MRNVELNLTVQFIIGGVEEFRESLESLDLIL